MTNLNQIISEIQGDEHAKLSAEARNALHAATAGHPWCEGKDFDTRKLEVRFAIAGRGIDANIVHRLERCTA